MLHRIMDSPVYQGMQGFGDYAIVTFLSNHGAVLVLVASQPRITATEIGSQLGITERPVRRIISELEAAGYLRRSRQGRTNRYEVNPSLPLPGPVFRDIAVGDLLAILRSSRTGIAETNALATDTTGLDNAV